MERRIWRWPSNWWLIRTRWTLALALLYVLLPIKCRVGAQICVDMNIPFAGVAAILVLLFVKLPTPPGSIRSKLEKIDWMYVVYYRRLRGAELMFWAVVTLS